MRLRSLALPLLLAALTISCGRHSRHTNIAYSWTGQLESGQWLHLRDLNGDVEVRRSTSGSVEVRGIQEWSGRRSPNIRFMSRTAGDGMYICALWASRGTCGPEGYSNHKSLWERIFRSRRNEHVAVRFVVSVPSGVRVDASTVNGDVSITGAAGDLVAKTINGSIDAATIDGSINASAVTGDVSARVSSAAAARGLRLSTVTGDVNAWLPAAAAANVDLATVTGELATDFPLAVRGQHRLSGVLGAGGAPVSLKTVTGDVRLRRS